MKVKQKDAGVVDSGREGVQAATSRMSHRRTGWFRRLLADVFFTARRDKKWWMLPLVAVLLFIAGLLAFVTLAGPLAPFIYPLL